jgi:hypothetical protein
MILGHSSNDEEISTIGISSSLAVLDRLIEINQCAQVIALEWPPLAVAARHILPYCGSEVDVERFGTEARRLTDPGANYENILIITVGITDNFAIAKRNPSLL